MRLSKFLKKVKKVKKKKNQTSYGDNFRHTKFINVDGKLDRCCFTRYIYLQDHLAGYTTFATCPPINHFKCQLCSVYFC